MYLSQQLSHLRQRKKFTEAEELYNSFKGERNIYMRSAMLAVYSSWKKYDEAERLYQEMGPVSDVITQTTMLSVYSNQGKYNEAEQLFREIGLEATLITKNTMLSLYAKRGEYDKARQLYQEIGQEADIITKNTMLSLYAKQGEYDKARQLHREIGPEATLSTKNTMLALYAKRGEYDKAQRLYQEIGQKADTITNNIMLSLYIKQERYNQAEQLYRKIGSEADIVNQTTMLSLYAKQGKHDKAQQLYRKIGSEATVATKNTMLSFYVKQGEYDKAQQLYLDIGPEATLITKNTMLALYAKRGEYDKAQRLYQEIGQKADTITNNIMLSLYIKQERYNQAEQLYRKIGSEADIVNQTTMLSLYAKQGKHDKAQQLYRKIGSEATVATKNTMLSFYVKQGEYDKAQQLYLDIGPEATIVTQNTMLKTYASQKKYVQAERLYQEIGSKTTIVTQTIMLSIYAEQGKYEEAEQLYQEIAPEATIVSQTTMLLVYAKQGKYEEAEQLYQEIGPEATIVTQNTMLKIYRLKNDESAAKQLFKSIPADTRTPYTYLAMSTLLLQNHTNEGLKESLRFFNKEMERMGPFFLRSKDPYLLAKLANRYHQLIELISKLPAKSQRNLQTSQQPSLSFLKKRFSQLVEPLKQHLNQQGYNHLTLQEAWLLTQDDSSMSFTPNYTILTETKQQAIQWNAWKSLNHPLQALDTKPVIRVYEINPRGEQIGYYNLNNSLYHYLTANEYDYLIVKLERPLSSSKLPLFLRYRGNVYRTDVFGGSKLKSCFSEERWGSLIAIPLEAGDFFQRWLTFEESLWYAQRAFLPEVPNQVTHGLKGQFTITSVPDHPPYQIFSNQPWIVQDGFGYIKKSCVKLTGLVPAHDCNDQIHSFLPYQALQGYLAKSYPQAVQQLAQQAIKRLEPKLILDDFCSAKDWYPDCIGSLPTLSKVGIPVIGNTLYLPKTPYWEQKAGQGLLVGRNPYNAKKLQALDTSQIAYSSQINQLANFQYTLTGYAQEQGKQIGYFFKGMLAVLSDNQWPPQYSEADLLVSSKDLKCAQHWLTAEKKKQDQETKKKIHINGMLVITQAFRNGNLVGIPRHLADRLSGDYDGDIYNLIPCQELEDIWAMVQQEQEQLLPNFNIPKSFTIRQHPGNYQKIMELRKPLLARWTVVENVFWSLSPKQQQVLADHLIPNNRLAEWGHRKYPDSLQALMVEIKLANKYGQDAYKTQIPSDSLWSRLRDYEQAIRMYQPLTVSYGKKLKKCLSKQLNPKDLLALCEKTLSSTGGHNVVDKAHRLLMEDIEFRLNYQDQSIPKEKTYMSSKEKLEGACSVGPVNPSTHAMKTSFFTPRLFNSVNTASQNL